MGSGVWSERGDNQQGKGQEAVKQSVAHLMFIKKEIKLEVKVYVHLLPDVKLQTQDSTLNKSSSRD